MVILSVRLSVCLSVEIDFEFSPYDSLVSLVFFDKISCHCVKGPHKQRGERGAPHLKRHYSIAIGSSNVKMVADRHRNAAYHNTSTDNELLRNVNSYDLG